MLKQSPSRNQRSKGFKVKHALHICLLLAFCVWLLYLKQTYGKREVLDEVSSKVEKSGTGSQYGILKLGRKGLDPQTMEIATEVKIREDEDDVFEIEDEEDKLRVSLGELRGAGDDEIDVHDLEKAEDEDEPDQLEDLIDEGDKEKEEDDERKGNVETDGFTEDVDFKGILKNSEGAKEERYRGEIIQGTNKLDGVGNSRT